MKAASHRSGARRSRYSCSTAVVCVVLGVAFYRAKVRDHGNFPFLSFPTVSQGQRLSAQQGQINKCPVLRLVIARLLGLDVRLIVQLGRPRMFEAEVELQMRAPATVVFAAPTWRLGRALSSCALPKARISPPAILSTRFSSSMPPCAACTFVCIAPLISLPHMQQHRTIESLYSLSLPHTLVLVLVSLTSF